MARARQVELLLAGCGVACMHAGQPHMSRQTTPSGRPPRLVYSCSIRMNCAIGAASVTLDPTPATQTDQGANLQIKRRATLSPRACMESMPCSLEAAEEALQACSAGHRRYFWPSVSIGPCVDAWRKSLIASSDRQKNKPQTIIAGRAWLIQVVRSQKGMAVPGCRGQV